MNSLAVRGWLLFAAVAALAYGGWTAYRVRMAEPVSYAPAAAPSEKIRDFTLTDQSGQKFGTGDLAGQVWVASFFFTSCGSTCRQLNQALAAVQHKVPGDVRFVSVTCDPDTDTPEALTRYAELFEADSERWKFLTGDMQDLQRVGHDIFHVALEKGTHSERAFVIDRQGDLRGRFNVLDPEQVEKLIDLVNKLDREPVTARRDEASHPPGDDAAANPLDGSEEEFAPGTSA